MVSVGIAERWVNDRIDNRVWEITNPVGGTDWAVSGKELSASIPTSGNALFVTKDVYPGAGGYVSTTSMDQTLVLEFELKIEVSGGIEQLETCFGLSNTSTGGLSTEDDFAGFGFDETTGLEIVPYVVAPGSKTEGSPSGQVAGQINKYKIIFDSSNAHFFINENYLETISVSGFSHAMYVKFYFENSGVAGDTIVTIRELDYRPYSLHKDGPAYWDTTLYHAKKETDKDFPVTLVSRFNPADPVTGRADTEVTVEYYKEGDSSNTAYAITATEWTEVEDGEYTLTIGADEFTDENTTYTVIVKDDAKEFLDYKFKVAVNTMTQDEMMAFFGSGTLPSTSYSFYAVINNMKNDYSNLRKLIQQNIEYTIDLKKRVSKLERK